MKLNYPYRIAITILFLIFGTQLQAQWIRAGNLSSASDYVRAMANNSSGTVIASSWNVGIFRSSDDGITWAKTSFTGTHGHYLAASPGGNFFALNHTTSSISIHRSTNDGVDWQEVYFKSRPNNFAMGGGMAFISADTIVAGISFTLGPTIGDIGAEMLKSVDGGASWSLMTTFNAAGFLNDMMLGNNGKIICATSLGGIVVSTNRGASWSTTSFTSYVSRLAKNPNGELFLGTKVADVSTPKIWRSTDNAVSWISSGLPQAGVEDLHIDDKGIIFVSGSNKIVYRSTDNGANWVNFNNGLPGTDLVYSLAGTSGDFMYAGTGNNSVFRYTDNPVTIHGTGNTLPEEFTLSQNYPNPFNPTTTIKFGLSEPGYVSLKVFDMLGKEVMVLVNKELAAGEYETVFDAASLTGGMYFYKMSVVTPDGKEFTETRKMALVK